jgi:hypothetical protein
VLEAFPGAHIETVREKAAEPAAPAPAEDGEEEPAASAGDLDEDGAFL